MYNLLVTDIVIYIMINKQYFIEEISINRNGDIKIAKELIAKAKKLRAHIKN